MTKWLSTGIYLQVEELQVRGHLHWTYHVASRVSQSRGFHPKNRKNIFFIKSSQNHLKRIENHFYNIFEYFFEKNIHLGLRKIPKFSCFSLDIATLDHRCSQTRNPMIKWFGMVVDLQVEKLQLRGYVH